MAWNDMSPADFAAVTGNNRGNDGMFGENSWLWIIVLFLFAGWGNGNGWGNGGGRDPAPVIVTNGGGGGYETRNAISEGFALNNLDAGIRAIQQGICDSTYALNNTMQSGFAGVNTNIMQGNNALGMSLMQGFNGVERQLCNMASQQQACCCDTNRAIERGFADTAYTTAQNFCDVRNQIERSTRDITENANGNTRAILDFLTQDKIESLRNENQALRFAASQAEQNAFISANQSAQTAELIRRLGADCPTPAYVVQPPTPVTFPTNGCGQVVWQRQSGCGGCSGWAA